MFGDPGVGELGLLGEQLAEPFGDRGFDLAAEQRDLHLDRAVDGRDRTVTFIDQGDTAVHLGRCALDPRREGPGITVPGFGARNHHVSGADRGDRAGQQFGGNGLHHLDPRLVTMRGDRLQPGVGATDRFDAVFPVLLVGDGGAHSGSRMGVASRVRQGCSHDRTRYRFRVRTSRLVPSEQLRDLLAGTGALIRESVPLAELTTLRVGGPATIAECTTTDTLIATVRTLDTAGVPVLLLAGGSNLLIADADVPGVVVRVATSEVRIGSDSVVAEAGANWDGVVAATVDAGFGGLECLSGIPGSAGATPVQNVGAYGVEVAQLLLRVQLLDRNTGQVRWVEPAELGFGYRTSVLKREIASPGSSVADYADEVHPHSVVLAVEFTLDPSGASAPLRYRELATTLDAAEGESRPAAQVRAAVLGLRARKGMVLDPTDHDTWSAGSFFTNPVVAETDIDRVLAAIRAHVGDVAIPTYPAPDGVKLSAGWLIERAGFAKGFPAPSAPARLSTKHTLALTNRGEASAADIIDLARTVRDGVAERFGVHLVPEPVTVGVRL